MSRRKVVLPMAPHKECAFYIHRPGGDSHHSGQSSISLNYLRGALRCDSRLIS